MSIHQGRCEHFSGCVQLGKVSISIGQRDERGSVEYKVTAPVLPYWGCQPKPGAQWILQHGRTTDDDSVIEERQRRLYHDGMLVRFEGGICHWPYQNV
jgi:hypothetical protein